MSTFLVLALLAVDPETLIRAAAEEDKRQEELRSPFVFRERQRNWNVDKSGRRGEKPWVERIYEHIFLEGLPYKQLIEKNGKAIVGAERQRLASAREQEAARRRENRKLRKPFLPGTRNIRMGTLAELPEAYVLKSSGEETVEGAVCDILEAEPNGRKETERLRELQSYRQRLWIAREKRVLVRRRVEVIGPDSEVLPGSIITFEWSPREEGIWFEKKREIEFGAKIFKVRTSRGYQLHEYFDYRRFAVESTITPADPD